jgi:hypothetical protein
MIHYGSLVGLFNVISRRGVLTMRCINQARVSGNIRDLLANDAVAHWPFRYQWCLM